MTMPEVTQPKLGPLGWARWAWRNLTSMRTALFLLLLLSVGAVPGSIFPQRSIDPGRVADYLAANPTSGRWLDRLGFFDVYSSVWFSAIYLLLVISLIGCIVPRTRLHWHALRSLPPRAPVRLERLAAQGWITPYRDWRRGGRLTRPFGAFNEAERCARWIIEQWFA